MVPSTKPFKPMSTTVSIEVINVKTKINHLILMTSLRLICINMKSISINLHYRLICGCLHKSFKFHVNNSLSNKQRQLTFKQRKRKIPILKTSTHNKHPLDYRFIIDRMVTSTKTLKFRFIK